MYILAIDGKQIVNSDFVERFCVSEKEDACLIVASYRHDRPPVTLARYKDLKEAKGALGDLLAALAARRDCFDMPDSLLYYAQNPKRDARTKRKGGS